MSETPMRHPPDTVRWAIEGVVMTRPLDEAVQHIVERLGEDETERVLSEMVQDNNGHAKAALSEFREQYNREVTA